MLKVAKTITREIFCSQDLNQNFEKVHNSDSKNLPEKNKNTGKLFSMTQLFKTLACMVHKLHEQEAWWMYVHISQKQYICPTNIFEVGGIL